MQYQQHRECTEGARGPITEVLHVWLYFLLIKFYHTLLTYSLKHNRTIEGAAIRSMQSNPGLINYFYSIIITMPIANQILAIKTSNRQLNNNYSELLSSSSLVSHCICAIWYGQNGGSTALHSIPHSVHDATAGHVGLSIPQVYLSAGQIRGSYTSQIAGVQGIC